MWETAYTCIHSAKVTSEAILSPKSHLNSIAITDSNPDKSVQARPCINTAICVTCGSQILEYTCTLCRYVYQSSYIEQFRTGTMPMVNVYVLGSGLLLKDRPTKSVTAQTMPYANKLLHVGLRR